MTVEELLYALGPLLGQRTAVEGSVRDWPVLVRCEGHWATPAGLVADEGRVIMELIGP